MILLKIKIAFILQVQLITQFFRFLIKLMFY